MIRLPFDFTYTVAYVPPRMQNARHMPMRGSTVLEFEELDPATTEHVANVTERHRFTYSSDRYGRSDRNEKVRVLYAGGSFWREDMSFEKLAAQIAAGNIESGYLDHIASRGTQSSELGDVAELTNAQRTAKVLARVPAERWNDDGGAATIERYRRRVADMAVFDGGVFVRTPMPVISLSQYLGRGIAIGAARSYGPGETVHGNHHLVFDLDELDRALEYQERVRPVRAGADDESFREKLEIEILRPGIWEAATHREAVLGSAKAALEAVMSKPDEVWVEMLDKAYDLRDALTECAGEVTPMLLQVLQDIAAMEGPSEQQMNDWRSQAEQYTGHWSKGRSSNLVEKSGEVLGSVRGLAEEALLRWEFRKPDASWEQHLEGDPILFEERGSVHQITTLFDARVIERLYDVDLSAETAACAEGRARLHVAVVGAGGVDYRSGHRQALIAEDEDGLRLVATSPDVDVEAVAAVVDRHLGRTFHAAAPAMAPGGVR